MGITKSDLSYITLVETMSNVISSTILGFIVGWIVTFTIVSMMQTVLELPVNFSVDWITLSILIVLSVTIVLMGNKLCMHIVNAKPIVSVLKGM